MDTTVGGLIRLAPPAVELLATQLLYSLIVAVTVLAGLRLFRVRSPSIHQAAWSLVLIRLVLPPGWSSSVSLRAVIDRALATGGHTLSLIAVRSADLEPTSDSVTASGGVVGSSAAIALWQPVAAGLWLLGAGALAALIVGRLIRYRRALRAARPVTRPEVLEQAEGWRRRLGIRRPVRLVSSNASLSPFTSGILAPVIYLPDAILTWARPEVESIVAHEMVHVRRWDELRIMLANLLRTVHFFNPAVWIAVNEIGQAREQLCDEAVLASGRIPIGVYSRSLVNVLKLSCIGSDPVDALVGLIDRKEGIKMRMITLHSERRSRPVKPAWIALGLLAGVLFALPMAPVEGRGDTSLGPISGRVAVSEDAVMLNLPPGVSDPLRLTTQLPVYPTEALESRAEGLVTLMLTVSAEGAVTDVEVVRPQPAGLTEAAAEAARTWSYRPAHRDGQAIEAKVPVVVRFWLEDGERAPIDPALLVALGSLLPEGVEVISLAERGDVIELVGQTDDETLVAQMLVDLDGSPRMAGRPALKLMQRERDAWRFRVVWKQ